MKKFIKLFTLVLAVALAASVSACDMADKTAARRDDYVAKATEYVQTLNQADYTAEDWALIEGFVAAYEETINTVAAKSKMEVALKELKANVESVLTYTDHIDAYIEAVDVRIQQALEEILAKLNPTTMGISNCHAINN